jgi:uracil-DNA glycosylase
VNLDLPVSWREVLHEELKAPYFAALSQFVDGRRGAGPVYPAAKDVFAAFHACPFPSMRVVIVGQDPYHGEGQAHGLCFSVPEGLKHPPSLRNILRELGDDIGVGAGVGAGAGARESGSLQAWAEQGVLLLNTVLTVDAGKAGSHQKQGWEKFTDAVIVAAAASSSPVVFVLWGAPAQKKQALLPDGQRCVTAPHPSPLSAYRGFFGSKPFSTVNRLLTEAGESAIDW